MSHTSSTKELLVNVKDMWLKGEYIKAIEKIKTVYQQTPDRLIQLFRKLHSA